MKNIIQFITVIAIAGILSGCGADHDHDHDHGHDHGHQQQRPALGQAGDHNHGERVKLGIFNISGINVEATQAHGLVQAGIEGHLIIKLPYLDQGGTTLRAWIGSEDRTLSSVGKGAYNAKNNLYDIHTVAPNPMPKDAQWWVEIEKPDGTKAVGSITLR